MPNLTRKDLEARYVMFQDFALEDQRSYYAATIKKHRKASQQVNQLRATISLLTGVAAASVGLIAAMNFNVCDPIPESTGFLPSAGCEWWGLSINVLIILATGLPAFAAFFNMLSDLYQWDKLIAIYDAAQENIEVADAHSPIDSMGLKEYRASLQAYAQGTLDVMSDETSQWGQSIRTPKGMQQYLDKAAEDAAKVSGDSVVEETDPSQPDDGT